MYVSVCALLPPPPLLAILIKCNLHDYVDVQITIALFSCVVTVFPNGLSWIVVHYIILINLWFHKLHGYFRNTHLLMRGVQYLQITICVHLVKLLKSLFIECGFLYVLDWITTEKVKFCRYCSIFYVRMHIYVPLHG